MLQNKKNLIIAVVLVLVVVGAGLFWKYRVAGNGYSVVYLTTGEVYVGQLSTFGGFTLKNGYILQVTKDPADATKNNFSLQPLSQALWAPKSLHLTGKNVVFYGALLPTSKIAETLAKEGK